MADACVFLMNLSDKMFGEMLRDSVVPPLVNLGAGKDLTIKELAELVRQATGNSSEIIFDPTKPDGTPRKLMDIGKLSALGWFPQTNLQSGIDGSYRDYVQQK